MKSLSEEPGRKLAQLRRWDLRSRRVAPRGPPRAFPRIAEVKVGSGRRVSGKATEETASGLSESDTSAAGSEPQEGRAEGAHAQCASSRAGLELPRGLLGSRIGPHCCRWTFSEAPRLSAGRRPRDPQARQFRTECGPVASLPPRKKAGDDHSPAGAAVAAAVPDVPEGAPKLKAISKEHRTGGPRCCSRDTACPPGFF